MGSQTRRRNSHREDAWRFQDSGEDGSWRISDATFCRRAICIWIPATTCFRDRGRHHESAVSSKREYCPQRVGRVVPVRKPPLPKPNRSHRCDIHRSGTPSGPERRTLRPVRECSGRPMRSSVRRCRFARTTPEIQCCYRPGVDADFVLPRRPHQGSFDSPPLKISR